MELLVPSCSSDCPLSTGIKIIALGGVNLEILKMPAKKTQSDWEQEPGKYNAYALDDVIGAILCDPVSPPQKIVNVDFLEMTKMSLTGFLQAALQNVYTM